VFESTITYDRLSYGNIRWPSGRMFVSGLETFSSLKKSDMRKLVEREYRWELWQENGFIFPYAILFAM